MPDIRKTSILDNFTTYEAYVQNTDYYPVSPVSPWYTAPGSNPVEVNGTPTVEGGLSGTQFPPVSCLGFFNYREAFSGNVETWGIANGSPAESDYWRWGMYTIDSIFAGQPSGYQALMGQGIFGLSYILRRYDSGTQTDIATAFAPHAGGIFLMRRNGGDVEVWQSLDDGATWTQYISVADNAHTGPFLFVYGATGVETGWSAIGGGLRNRQHIYRWIRGQ